FRIERLRKIDAQRLGAEWLSKWTKPACGHVGCSFSSDSLCLPSDAFATASTSPTPPNQSTPQFGNLRKIKKRRRRSRKSDDCSGRIRSRADRRAVDDQAAVFVYLLTFVPRGLGIKIEAERRRQHGGGEILGLFAARLRGRPVPVAKRK